MNSTRLSLLRDRGFRATLALGLGTAFFRLNAHGLWGDEVWQALWSRQQDLPGTFIRFRAPPDFPLHFLWVNLTTQWSGEAFWVRLPSAVLGALTVPTVYLLGCRALNRQAALIAAVLLAFAPFHVWFTQDARPYAALGFYSLLSLLFFAALVEKVSWRAWLGLTLATTLNLYNHFFALMPLLSELVALVLLLGGALWQAARSRPGQLNSNRAPFIQLRECLRALGAFVASAIVAFGLAAPIVPGFVKYILARGPGEVQAPPFQVTPEFLIELFGMFGGGVNWSLLLLLGLAVLGIITAVRQRKTFAPVGIVWMTLPLLILSLAQPRHIFIPRYFIFLQPVYLLLAAYGIVELCEWLVARLRQWQVRGGTRLPLAPLTSALVTGLALVALFPPAWQSYWVERINDWSALCQYLHQNAKPGDAIAGDAYFVGLMMWCYPNRPLPLIPGNNVKPEVLTRRGLNLWFINIEGKPETVWRNAQFELVPRGDWSKRELELVYNSGGFTYLQGERVARLWHYTTPEIPERVGFDDVSASDGSGQASAEIAAGEPLALRLRLPANAPRRLSITAQQSAGGNLRVLINGKLIGRYRPKENTGLWQELDFPLPPAVGDEFLVELVNPTVSGVHVREVQVQYRTGNPP